MRQREVLLRNIELIDKSKEVHHLHSVIEQAGAAATAAALQAMSAQQEMATAIAQAQEAIEGMKKEHTQVERHAR